MRIKALALSSIMALFSVVSHAEQIENGGDKPERLIAKASHTCGERRYVLEGESLTSDDELAIRDIISFLFQGANILLQYSGAPEPSPNEATLKAMAANDYAVNSAKRSFKYRNKTDPSPQQLEEQLVRDYSLDPTSWNIHDGPKPDRIKQILADKKFSKRLGSEATKLIESRMRGELGQRPQILAELDTQFHVKEVPNYWSDENCHILDGFGPD